MVGREGGTNLNEAINPLAPDLASSVYTVIQYRAALAHHDVAGEIMKSCLWAIPLVVMLLGGLVPVCAADDEVITLTTEAVKDLSPYPGNGKRSTAYEQPGRFWGADYRQHRKATVKLKAALDQARQTGAPKEAIVKLEEAVEAGESGYHKDARLRAQGALAHLCKGMAGTAPLVCKDEELVPKSGVILP
jgi:hypothetical protein